MRTKRTGPNTLDTILTGYFRHISLNHPSGRLSQENIAKRSGVSAMSISRLVSGKIKWHTGYMLKIAERVLGITPQEFITDALRFAKSLSPSDGATAPQLVGLTGGALVIIDACDLEWANQWKWSLLNTHNLYAVRGSQESQDDSFARTLMHREILGRKIGRAIAGVCHHVNRNTLDNRRVNLRELSLREHAQLDNRKIIRVTAWGETKSLKAWACDPRSRVNRGTLNSRIMLAGWTVERALTTPPHGSAARTTK